MSERPPTGHLVLVGMMGSGKTTVGRLVAARLGRPLVDTDTEVEARAGRPVSQIFEEDGEEVFRALESDVLVAALASVHPAVVAAAGGAVLSAANRAALAGAGHVVWLRSDPSILARRVVGGSHRPLLGDDPAAVLARLAVEREPLYLEVADEVVDTDDLDADAVAQRVVAACGASA